MGHLLVDDDHSGFPLAAHHSKTNSGSRDSFPCLAHLRDWRLFDADTGKDSAREIREYFIPDFSNWKNHDSYQEAFQRLLSDLKASDTRPK
jgi:hypothetical protein